MLPNVTLWNAVAHGKDTVPGAGLDTLSSLKISDWYCVPKQEEAILVELPHQLPERVAAKDVAVFGHLF
eukprot:ANDGO_07213.mRNA.1 hypothetical protein